MPAYVLAALIVAAAPITLAIESALDSNNSDSDGLVSIVGKVTAYLTDDEEFENEIEDHDNETHDHDDNETCDHDDNETHEHDDLNETEGLEHVNALSHSEYKQGYQKVKVITAFIIDNKTVVTCGPWWYWAAQSPNITDVVHVGDTVNVTGEFEREDGMDVLSAWKIVNITTGEELTIKEEGRPPWAGGPKALVLVPWPSEEDE